MKINGGKRTGRTMMRLGVVGVVLMAIVPSASPATRTWTGLSLSDSRWSNPVNWSGGNVPQGGEDLVFPTGALIHSMNNNLPSGRAYHSLRFEDDGYSVAGNPIGVSGGISSTRGSGRTEIFCHLKLLANQTFRCDSVQITPPSQASVVYKGSINLNGFNLNLSGLGFQRFAHSLAGSGSGSGVTSSALTATYENIFNNDYTGTTTVLGQLFYLHSPAANLPRALNGPLVIGPGNCTVVQLASSQINNPLIPVTINEGAEWDMTLGVRDVIGSLTLQGGRLTLANWRVTANDITVLPAGRSSVITGDPARDGIGGQPGMLIVGRDPTSFNVQPAATLEMNATLTDREEPEPPEVLAPPGPEIIKVGLGTLALNRSNGFAGDLIIAQGRVHARHPEALGLGSSKTILQGGELFIDSTTVGTRLLNVESMGLINSRGQSRCDANIQNLGLLRIETSGANSRLSLGTGIGSFGNLHFAARDASAKIVMDGSDANVFSSPVFVDLGVVELQRGVANGAITDELTIGNATDPDNSASVQLPPRLAAPFLIEQIGDRVGVLVNGSGQLVVANVAEEIGSLAGAGHVVLASSRLTAGGNDRSTTFTGILSGNGGYTKEGSGAQRLTGPNTYNDSTLVNHGTLIVNGQQPSSRVTVETPGTLGGIGRVGDLLVKGRLAPGEAVGRLTCSDFGFTGDAVFEVQLNGTSAGVNHDQLRVLGQVVNLSNARLIATLGYTPAAGDSFVIIDNDGTDAVTGTFKNLPEGASFLVGNRRMTITYRGGTGNDVVITTGPLVLAGSRVWTGGFNGFWSVAANWLGNVPPEDGDDLVFPAGAVRLRTTNDLPAGLLVDSIIFERGGFAIAGNEFALNTMLLSTNSGAAQTNEISANVELLDAVTMHVESGIVLATNVLRGPGGVTKSGPGTLRFAGAGTNTYLGSTLVLAGVLELNKSSGYAVPANTAIEIGGAFDPVAPPSRNVLVRCLRSNQMPVTTPVTIHGTGLLDLNGFNGDIGALTLRGGAVQTGSGLLGLGRDVTASGATVSGAFIPAEIDGNVHLGFASRRFTVGPVGGGAPGRIALEVKAVIQGETNLIKSGPEAMRLSGANTFTGAVTVDQGLLVAAHSSALGAIAGGVTVTGSGALALGDGVNVGAEALVLDRSTASAALQMTSGSASWSGPIALVQNSRITVETNSSLTLAGGLGQLAGNVRGLIKDGPGALELAARSTFTGLTLVAAGTLRLNDAVTGLAITGDLTVGTGTGTNVARVEAIGINQIAGTSRVLVNADGLIDWSGIGINNETIGSLAGRGRVALGAARLTTGNNNDSTAFEGAISGVGGRLTKTGTGRFTLAGTNTYTGLSVVEAGELRINGFQPASPVRIRTGGTLTGIGTVGTITGLGGTLAPGADLGKLTVAGNLFLSSTDIFHVQIRGTNDGEFDQLQVNGDVALNDARLQLDLLSALSPLQRLFLIRNAGAARIAGQFSNAADALCTCAGTLSIHYEAGDGNDVELGVTDQTCVFRLTDLQPGDSQVTLCWESVPGRKYRIEQAPSPSGPWFPAVQSVTASGTRTCYTWARTETAPQMNYRVVLICD